MIKKGFYSQPRYKENFLGNKKLIKDKYYGHSILLQESIFEVENKYYPQTLFDKFFECNYLKKHNKNSLFKELVKIVDWSDDDESSDKS